MPTLAEIRQQFPQYGDLSDQQLADGLHSKFYSDIPRAEFDAKIGIAPQTVPSVPAADGAPARAVASAAPVETGSAVGRIASRAGEVAKERFGDQPLGLSDQTTQELREKGILAPEGGQMTPIWALNELVYRYGSKAGDLALRAIAAGIGGLQGAAGQTAQELGADPGMARRLERDVGTLAETAGVVAGTAPAVPRAPAAGPAATAERAATAAGETVGPQAVKVASPAGAAEFRAASSPFYKAAEDAGVVIKPESYGALAQDIGQTARKNRLDETLTPGSVATLKRIEKLTEDGAPVSFEDLDIMRQLAGDARKQAKAGSNDARVAGLMIDKIDDYIAKIGGKDVIAGDTKVAADTIVKARDLWARAAKLETVEDIIDRATTSAGQFSGSGFENALRSEFRSLAKSKERMKGFSADEQKAIKLVARGSAAANTARNIGKLAPTGVVSGALSGGIGASIGTALGVGPVVGAAATTSVGFAARKLATALTQRSIRRLEDLIRTKGENPRATAAIARGNNLLAALQEASIAAAAPGEER